MFDENPNEKIRFADFPSHAARGPTAIYSKDLTRPILITRNCFAQDWHFDQLSTISAGASLCCTTATKAIGAG
jgi:hypothetical protein